MFRAIWIALALAAAASDVNPAFADPSSDLKDCAAISDPAKRLVCFDVLAEKAALNGSAGAANKKSGWSVASTVSPITDKKEVFLQRRSQKPVETDVFGVAHPAFLIQCLNGKTSVAVNWGFIVDGGTIPVTYRIDAGEPKTVGIQVSEDFRSIASWDSDRSIAFLKTLLGKEKLAVQVTALSQGPVQAVFDMDGLDKAISPLRKSLRLVGFGKQAVSAPNSEIFIARLKKAALCGQAGLGALLLILMATTTTVAQSPPSQDYFEICRKLGYFPKTTPMRDCIQAKRSNDLDPLNALVEHDLIPPAAQKKKTVKPSADADFSGARSPKDMLQQTPKSCCWDLTIEHHTKASMNSCWNVPVGNSSRMLRSSVNRRPPSLPLLISIHYLL